MSTRKAKIKPSRIRYEMAHPTVSFRINRQIYDQLKAVISTLGNSFGQWVKAHLDQDDQRATARAETLARHRDGLGRDIEQKHQMLARLEQQIAQRQQQLKVSVEEERERKLKEAQRYGEDLKASYEFALLNKQAELDRLQRKQGEREEQLEKIERQIKEATGVLEMARKQQAAMEAALLQKMLEECRKRPEVFRKVYCEACPGYGWARLPAELVAKMSRPAPQPGDFHPAGSGGP